MFFRPTRRLTLKGATSTIMWKNKNSIAVFTFKGVNTILHDGGTSSWNLNPEHAGHCEFAICTRNVHFREPAQGSEPHHTAFLVGRIKDVVKSTTRRGPAGPYYLIRFSSYAHLNESNGWKRLKGGRNPVRYADIERLIDPSRLKWRPMPKRRHRMA
jgi:hypothetical protein